MITCNVFSKNRPMQLDLLLRSIYQNASYVSQINILYTYNDNIYDVGYNILIKQYPKVNFLKENDRYSQIIELVNNSNKYFFWATDDSIFYKKSDLTEDKIDWTFNTEKCKALNLRMGLNIKWQNHWHSEISQPIDVKNQYKDLISWDANKYSVNTDVGRVWQNDASIMERDLYIERLKVETGWRQGLGVRELDNLAGSGRIFNPCFMASFKESVYLNVPVNLVHLLNDGRLYADNWGKYRQYDVKTLNELFLQGIRINLEKIDVSNIDCGRKELEYAFI